MQNSTNKAVPITLSRFQKAVSVRTGYLGANQINRNHADVAQLVERRTCNTEVAGSIPA